LNTAGRKNAAEAKAGSGVISGAEEIPWVPRITSVSSNIYFISESFPILQYQNPSADFCNKNRWMDHRTAYGLDGINKIYRIEG
jgi:hypothetical protein